MKGSLSAQEIISNITTQSIWMCRHDRKNQITNLLLIRSISSWGQVLMPRMPLCLHYGKAKNSINIITARRWSCWKVIFSQVSVCPRGVCLWREVGLSLEEGVCLWREGLPWERTVHLGGMHLGWKGVGQPPPPLHTWDTMGYGQQVDGMHPTECILVFADCIWSMGKGNVFTPVCHSVHRGVCLFPAYITGHMTR